MTIAEAKNLYFEYVAKGQQSDKIAKMLQFKYIKAEFSQGCDPYNITQAEYIESLNFLKQIFN